MAEKERRLNPLVRIGEYSDEKGRDYFFDNARFILIVLVVVGHFIQPMTPDVPVAKYIWRLIYTLHMPCMIFISGYFSKSYIKKNGFDIQRPFTYTILFVTAQALFTVFRILIGGNKVPTILQAQTGLWYLQCLIIWSLVLPFIDRLKPKYVMIGAIICGLLVGYDVKAGSLMSMCRAISHFPYFLAGYYIQKETVQKLFSRRAKLLGVAALAAVMAVYYVLRNYGIGDVIISRKNYWDLGFLSDFPIYVWWGTRVFTYVCSGLMCFGFLALVPRSWTFFTRFGSRTLQVYILHMPLYIALDEFGWWIPFDSGSGMLAMIGIAVAAAFILSFKLFNYPFAWLQSIRIKPLLRDTTE